MSNIFTHMQTNSGSKFTIKQTHTPHIHSIYIRLKYVQISKTLRQHSIYSIHLTYIRLYLHICLHTYNTLGQRLYINIHTHTLRQHNRPTQSLIYVLLHVTRFQKTFSYRSVQYSKSCSGDFILQNLILRTRSCGNGFITQSSWGFHFHLTNIRPSASTIHVKYCRSFRNAFSNLVHRQYKSFPDEDICQGEIKNTTGWSNKPSTA